ncbi:hypothetical protein D7322_15890 [Sphingobacterium puteale]|uniref:Uncharacterized protein n=1 Tax=Sphingobacterium puteale TaxID=2420510 RepID=A0A420VWJ6_9SPHI|nr:hypothetical protein D7322_15890 [Sphingobacterium puteale]
MTLRLADGMIERDPATGKIIFNSIGTFNAVKSPYQKYLMRYENGTIRTDKQRDVFVERLLSVEYNDKDGNLIVVEASKTHVNGIPMSQCMSNCNGLTFGDGEFFIDGYGAGKILADEYTELQGYEDKGNNPKDVPDHNVMSVGRSQPGDFWEPFHSASKSGNGYRNKNDINPIEENASRDEATNYVRYEKGSEGFNQIMNYIRKYFKKNETENN